MAYSIAKHKASLVSVVMSVYNGERYVRKAIDSIIAQTLTDFEFIIIDDGSSDKTLSIIKSYRDKRIVLITRENRGLVASLNEGIKKAQGKYIARQDADDVSQKNRLAQQVKCAQATSAILVGSAFTMIDLNGKPVGQQAIAETDDFLHQAIRVGNPFAHGSILAHRESILAIGEYSATVGPVEDYDLWLRLAPKGKFAAINRSLYHWRVNPDGISHQQSVRQVKSAEKLQRHYNKDRPLTHSLVRAQLRAYWRLRKSPRELDQLLAEQIIRERQKLIHVSSSLAQKVALIAEAACFQPGITRQSWNDVDFRVRRKINYLRERGRRK